MWGVADGHSHGKKSGILSYFSKPGFHLIFGIPWWLAHPGVVEMVLWIRFFTSVEDENFGCKTSVFFIGRKIKLHHEEILTASGGKYFSIGTENMEMSGNDFTCNKPTIY